MRSAILLLLLFVRLAAQQLPIALPEEVVVDLANPTFKEGILSSDEGGVIRAEGLRLQARHIRYIQKSVDGEKISRVEAWGDLMFERGCDVFTGEYLEYDFIAREGKLKRGRSAIGPWYVGGQMVHLCSNGSYLIDNAFLTTCEDADSEWALRAKRVRVTSDGYINAQFVNIRFGNFPVFWMPNFRTHLRSLLDAPIQYRGEVGGAQGTRLGLRYRFFSWREHKAYLRAEYLLERGPAIALETEYEPCGSDTRAYTQSYIARDNSIAKPKERTRWRYAGHYKGHPLGRCDTKAQFHYDVLSDPEMATDYLTDDFNLHTARRTQLEVTHQRKDVTANYFTRVRVNTFQTISQELPTLTTSLRPRTVGTSGVISVARASTGYQDFVFARQSDTPGFHSSRASLQERLYRPFRFGQFNVLPEFEAIGIYYSNNPTDQAQMLASFEGSCEANFRLSRIYGSLKHVVEPYSRYSYYTTPTSLIPEHFIFSEHDAYTRMSFARFGFRNLLYRRGRNCCRPLALDLFAYGFFSTPTIVGSVPRVYANLTWHPRGDLTTKIESAWNIAHNRVDHFNGRLELTVSEDAAFAVELRYRSPYRYLKADLFDWVLDSFTPESVLLASPLSDRRYTILTDCFFRITPTTAIQLETRHGFKQRTTPAYNEGRITLHKVLHCRWHLSMYYEHLELDDRFAVNIKLGPGKCPRPIGHTPTNW